MRTKIPVVISGIAGIAATVAFSLPAAAAQPAGIATPTAASVHVALSSKYSDYRVRPGDSVEFTGPCGSIRHGELVELIGGTVLDSGFAYQEEACGTAEVRPTWHGTVSKTAQDGVSTVHYLASGGDFGASVRVVGAVPPPTTTPPTTTPPTTTPPITTPPSTTSTAPSQPSAPTQQVPVKPKGAPQTGGGGMAAVVGTWS